MNEIKSNIFVSTVVLEDGKVLMMREAKNNQGQRGTWNFPAGHAEHGESLSDAAVRETREETGYSVKLTGVVAIQKKDFDSGDMKFIVFFAGEMTDKDPIEPGDETDRVEFVPLENMHDLNIRFPEMIKVAERAASGKIVTLDILAFEDILNKGGIL